MKARMERLGDPFHFNPADTAYIVGDRKKYSPRVLENINASKVIFVTNLSEVPKSSRAKAVIIEEGFFDKIFRPSRVPFKMESPRAKNWSADQYLMLKLFERGISVKTSF